MEREAVHELWATANHDSYKLGWPRTQYLGDVVKRHLKIDNPEILELGCNVGRNLEFFRKAGYSSLSGVEINPNSKHLREEVFPDLAALGRFTYLPLEEYLENHSKQFDLVYTMAVLEHIHPDSAWVLEKLHTLLKPNGLLILIEDELNEINLPFVFQRSYAALPGMQQIEMEDAAHVEGLKEGYITRVYKRA